MPCFAYPFYMELFIIGKFIGCETYNAKKYLTFVIKNWLLEMWVEELRVNIGEDNDYIFEIGRFYLVKTIPSAYHHKCVYAKLCNIRGLY
ncbi:MAG: hypothetical protein HYV97_14415 [Bdellovibrio sp.]|nr:hypothetical protein [Bdellovibrio sp.]